MEDKNTFEESTKYYTESDNNVAVATPSLQLLHQQFIEKICKAGSACNHGNPVIPNIMVNPISPQQVWSPPPSAVDKEQYYCYRPMFDSFEFTQHTFIDSNDKFIFDGFLLISKTSLNTLVPILSYRNFNQITHVSLKPHPLPKNVMEYDLTLFNYYMFEVLLEIQNCFEDNSGIYYYPVFKSAAGVIASMATVLNHLITSFTPINLQALKAEHLSANNELINHLIYNPRQRPSTLRIDKLTWTREGGWCFIHHCHVFKQDKTEESSIEYCDMKKNYDSLHRQNTRGELSRKDYFKMIQLRNDLRRLKKRRYTEEEVISLSCDGHMTTGLYSDIAQYALVLPVIDRHINYHILLRTFEEKLCYRYNDRLLLQTALTHPSYLIIQDGHTPLLVSQDHCGLPPKPVTSSNAKRFKSGLERLSAAVNNIEDDCSDNELYSNNNNERLEFLGDAIVELITSYHLHHMFPQFSDGELVIYRKALICNKHLAKIAEEHLQIDRYILMNKTSVLSTERDTMSTRANSLEAIIGSVYLDTGLQSATQVLSKLFFPEQDLYDIWMNIKPHPLKQQYPHGDRHIIPNSTILQKFTELEDKVGIVFDNICLLGKAFVHPSFGYTDLFKGNYQQMEFLGDAILQLITSLYVYKTFPNNHEGHLTVFRMAIVHNKQLAKVSEELGFTKYILLGKDQVNHLTEKIKADVIESFIAAVYLDKGFIYAEKFCAVCLFPKLFEDSKGLQFIDAKSRLQHSLVYTCKLKRLDIVPPVYKVLSAGGTGQQRTCTVGVYFRKERLAIGSGHNTQSAGMVAAENALMNDKVIVPRTLKK